MACIGEKVSTSCIKSIMRPNLHDYNKINLTKEQIQFNERVAREVMGWTQLDESYRADFERHIVPEKMFPFFETFSKNGVIVYHPTTYHAQMFSPSTSEADDIASLITLLDQQPESIASVLSMLHLIHYKRALADVSFVPSDEFYRIARYYEAGDFSTIALHLIKKRGHEEIKDKTQMMMELGKKYLGKYGIGEFSFSEDTLTIKCKDKSFIPIDVQNDLESIGMRIIYKIDTTI